MPSLNSKSQDDLILHQALDARMLKAIEFAAVAAELESLDVSADKYLVSQGYISEEQRQRILALLSDEGEPVDATQMDSAAKQPFGGSRSSPNKSQRVTAVREVTTPLTSSADDSRYEWIEKYAQGGLGAVWRARDTSIERNVALKEILPKARLNDAAVQQFLVEARVTGQLQHPGVVPIYDIGTNPDGCPFYIMKFIEGQTLHDAIRMRFAPAVSQAERGASLRKLLGIFVQVCRTLEYAHDQQIIHRDLKPRNIMLGQYGETLVVDWGLAMPISEQFEETLDLSNADPSSRRRSGRHGSRATDRRVVGTPAYLAPEQARGEIHLMDARSDIYSLGVVLFEILTGLTPFPGKDSQTIIAAVLSGKFPTPRQILGDVPSPLNSICLKAMQFQPQLRFASAGEMADEIERFLDGERVSCHPETRVERVQRILAKNKKTTFSVLCGLCLLSLVIGFAAVKIDRARSAEVQARLAADEARVAETRAKQRETVAKKEAVSNLRTALDAVDKWLLELSGELEFYPGLSGKRTEFLENAANYYTNLAAPGCDDPSLKEEAARASIRGGDVQQLLGHTSSATVLFENAITWFRSELLTSPSDTDAQKELANALIGQAITLSRARVPDHAIAKTSLREATDLLQSLAAKDTKDIDIRTAMARVSVANGRIALATNNPADAISYFEDSRRRLFDIAKLRDIPARHIALYHSTLFELSYLYLDEKQFDCAREIAQEAIRSFDRLITINPARPDYYEGRMTARILLGNARESARNDDDALDAYKAASNDYRELMAALFRGEYQSENLVAAQINRGQIHFKRNEIDKALAILDSAHLEAKRLVELRGQQPRLLRIFAAASHALADVKANQEDADGARKAYQDAILVLEYLQQQKQANGADEERLTKAKHGLKATQDLDVE